VERYVTESMQLTSVCTENKSETYLHEKQTKLLGDFIDDFVEINGINLKVRVVKGAARNSNATFVNF
jgi:hypothetical protein